MHSWFWQTGHGLPYLTCSLLERWPHGFFTRQFAPQLPQDLTMLLAPEADVLRVKQVHGNQVLGPQDIRAYQVQQAAFTTPDDGATFPDADGVATDGPHQAAWVCSADCTPVLIADERTGQVSAIHAGWRGTAARIVPVAIACLQAQGSRIEDLRVAMGPAIAGEVYQVTADVAAQVGRSIPEIEALVLAESLVGDEAIVQALLDLPIPPVLADEKPGHVRLDVRQVNALQMEQLGLSLGQIAIAPHCTYQDPENFFSYRRDNRKQIQWSGIVSTFPG